MEESKPPYLTIIMVSASLVVVLVCVLIYVWKVGLPKQTGHQMISVGENEDGGTRIVSLAMSDHSDLEGLSDEDIEN